MPVSIRVWVFINIYKKDPSLLHGSCYIRAQLKEIMLDQRRYPDHQKNCSTNFMDQGNR